MYAERLTWRKAARVLCTPTNLCAIGQGLFGSIPWGMLLTFLNDFLAQDRGLSVQHATTVGWEEDECFLEFGWGGEGVLVGWVLPGLGHGRGRGHRAGRRGRRACGHQGANRQTGAEPAPKRRCC